MTTSECLYTSFKHTNKKTGKYVSSSDLVPGDIYELSDPNLTQLPSDSLLLTGDCIVNESMLTGKMGLSFDTDCI
jgi:P-type E1-E2 ATPase